ncbi:MAG: 2-C-methyl-D-erythritol 4-phosphate cytidylyltransferase, partial [Lachnospiraceae bacterium]|nr:2-C-methyl-D-erythritol 4-phosphate cytidylyltransferase [Lachnospiraceae bacterium]
LLPDKILSIKGSSEPAVMAGMDIAIIKGDENNFKITTDNDLTKYRAVVESESE